MLYEISEKAMQLEKEGKKIINFNLGDPDMQTPTEIVEAATEAMRKGLTKYSFAAGEIKLRRELARIHGVSANNVVVSPGSKWAVFSLMYLLLKNGGNVIIPTPYWTSYGLIAQSLGVEARLLKTEITSKWQIDIEKLDNLIDRNTRMIVLNNPNNPTSKSLDDNTLGDIVQLANEKKVMILSDEVYADISFVKPKSILDFEGEHILISSFSKTFAMTGWRIGYAIVGKDLAEKMMKLNQITVTNVPVFVQEAAVKALELKERIAHEMRTEYRRRADLACSMLSKTKLTFTEPDAPFYLFPRCEGLNSEEFTVNLLDKGVAITPGSAFGDYNEHFRIALTVPQEKIRIGLETLREAL